MIDAALPPNFIDHQEDARRRIRNLETAGAIVTKELFMPARSTVPLSSTVSWTTIAYCNAIITAQYLNLAIYATVTNGAHDADYRIKLGAWDATNKTFTETTVTIGTQTAAQSYWYHDLGEDRIGRWCSINIEAKLSEGTANTVGLYYTPTLTTWPMWAESGLA